MSYLSIYCIQWEIKHLQKGEVSRTANSTNTDKGQLLQQKIHYNTVCKL